MTLLSATPALPVLDVPRAVDYFATRFGFEASYSDDEYGVVTRDDVAIHVWAANKPGTAGAEPHLAGTGSCRVRVSDVEALYEEMRQATVVHPNGAIDDHPWGREFTTLDIDGNAIIFYQG